MKYEHIYYLTKDKSLDIEFLFLDLGPSIGWRAYILSDINYKRVSRLRSDSGGTVHRLKEIAGHRYVNSNRDYYYICWTKPIYSLESIRKLAQMWSEITAYYIKYGGTFDTIQPLLKARGIINM